MTRDMFAETRHGSTRVTEQWTDDDGSIREEFVQSSPSGTTIRGSIYRPPPNRLQRFERRWWLPRPFRSWVRCHGYLRACHWCQTFTGYLLGLTVCRWRGHDLVSLGGDWELCWRCGDIFTGDGSLM